jgi:Protein of unknown function (DUF3175)
MTQAPFRSGFTPAAKARAESGRLNLRAAMVKRSGRKWSGAVTRQSDALDLKEDVFNSSDPDAIAKSLKLSAEASHRRKASPYRSAMSMLTFYVNRAGKNLSSSRRRILERAKNSLRKAFHRKEASS